MESTDGLFGGVRWVWPQRVREAIVGKDTAGEEHHHIWQCPTMHWVACVVTSQYRSSLEKPDYEGPRMMRVGVQQENVSLKRLRQ